MHSEKDSRGSGNGHNHRGAAVNSCSAKKVIEIYGSLTITAFTSDPLCCRSSGLVLVAFMQWPTRWASGRVPPLGYIGKRMTLPSATWVAPGVVRSSTVCCWVNG